MHIETIVTRTDAGATTQIRMDGKELRKDYASWNDALEEARKLELVNTAEAAAAKILPPGFPLHASAEVEAVDFTSHGFSSEKLPPPA